MPGHRVVDHPWVDSSKAPIYRTTFPARSSDVEMKRYGEALAHFAENNTAHVLWLADVSQVSLSSPKGRQRLAESESRLGPYTKKFLKAMAIVVTNPVARGAVTAVYWLAPPVYPYRIFSNLPDAEAWLRSKLPEVTAPPPPR